MFNLFNIGKTITSSLVAVLTDHAGNIIDIVEDGQGGPVLVTNDPSVFKTIAEAIYDLWD